MTKHTPGPWTVSCGSVYQAGWIDGDGFPISCIAHMDRDNPNTAPSERDANARLIAAAPKLLEALQLAQATIERLNRHDSANGTLDVVRVAIDRADHGEAAKGEAPPC